MSTATDIQALLSRGLTDWSVSAADEWNIIWLLAAASDVSRVVTDLSAAGALEDLVDRVDESETRPILMQILGGRSDPASVWKLRPIITSTCEKDDLFIFEACAGLQGSLTKLGLVSAGTPFDPKTLAGAVGPTASSPFSGAGATGVSPMSGNVPLVDQALLLGGNAATTAQYSNPIPGSLPGYLAGLTPKQRLDQATLLLRRSIVTLYPYSYGSVMPSRAAIIRCAGRAHNLEPSLVAAMVLAEQRDQSANEDAKDYTAAVSLKSANTSIGLGQVVVSTVMRNDLFADLLPALVRPSLDHKKVAALLTSDELNLFAVARYARKVANDGAKITLATLPNTQAEFPGIMMLDYAKNSMSWPRDNIRALGSEYTSRAWDDHLSVGWGNFVLEAYDDVKGSGVF